MKTCCFKLFMYIWLFGCMCGGGLVGPMSNVVPAEGFWLMNSWRQVVAALLVYVLKTM